jgi:hypothetical protein
MDSKGTTRDVRVRFAIGKPRTTQLTSGLTDSGKRSRSLPTLVEDKRIQLIIEPLLHRPF